LRLRETARNIETTEIIKPRRDYKY
jgi:hypothetical protein